jgi:hypothetical protein
MTVSPIKVIPHIGFEFFSVPIIQCLGVDRYTIKIDIVDISFRIEEFHIPITPDELLVSGKE